MLNRTVGLLGAGRRMPAGSSGAATASRFSVTTGGRTLWSWFRGIEWVKETAVLLRDVVLQLDYIAAQR
jgi:hypothetical protein